MPDVLEKLQFAVRPLAEYAGRERFEHLSGEEGCR